MKSILRAVARAILADAPAPQAPPAVQPVGAPAAQHPDTPSPTLFGDPILGPTNTPHELLMLRVSKLERRMETQERAVQFVTKWLRNLDDRKHETDEEEDQA